MKDLIVEIEGLLPKSVIVNIKDSLTVTEDIDHEVDTASPEFGFYAVLAEKAESRYQKMKLAFETWQAQVESKFLQEKRIEVRTAPKEAKAKLPTVDQLKSHVRVQSKYRAYQIKLIEFDEHRRILKIVAKAFEMKAEMVRTKSANRRKE